MDKSLPFYSGEQPGRSQQRKFDRRWTWLLPVVAVLVLNARIVFHSLHTDTSTIPFHSAETLSKCRALDVKPAPPPHFSNRSQSDRFQPGTRPVFIRNATIWTGGAKGLEVIEGDVLLDHGIIQAVGVVERSLLDAYSAEELLTLDVRGAWVSPGIVDLHSHIAVESAPALSGASDGNSLKGLALPWLRSLDGLNTHDASYRLSISGGVTTSLILPGSADGIGGQAFVIKLRPTEERSPTSFLLEPPASLNGSSEVADLPPRWRHMKHACGENPARVYSGSRMDTVWSVREAYEKARQIKVSQDEYCSKALAGQWESLGEFPEELQWEALVDVLRGKVKVQTHCYEAVDIDAFVRLSNEFQFPVAAFHHAHEAYLVPDVLKRAYKNPPAIAMFAAFSRYKREAFRHSEFAPRILADAGIKVVMKSDHPAIISRFLLHEAQQAHYYGLADNMALSSVISTPAEVLGLDHRIGFIREGYDADLVVWDSHPLALGATPAQVFIDGIPQIERPFVNHKPPSLQKPPKVPNFDVEAAEAVKHEGLPPLAAKKAGSDTIIFRNVSQLWVRDGDEIQDTFTSQDELGTVIVVDGEIVCSGELDSCAMYTRGRKPVVVDLEGGCISPALVSYGSQLGLQEISMEPSTTDGVVYDPLTMDLPRLLGHGSLVKAVDGLQYGTRDALLAYRAGVTSAITPPQTAGFLSGLSTAFSVAAPHKLAQGAILRDVAAFHVSISHQGTPSVSTQIGALRQILLDPPEGEIGKWSKKVAGGLIPLVVAVDNADIIATLIQLKQEVEDIKRNDIKMTLTGASEAHLLAKEIASSGIGVILAPPRSFPYVFEGQRILPGPPLTQVGPVAILASHNVTVGIGPQGIGGGSNMATWAVRNLRFDAGWLSLESNGQITKAKALAMASSNIEKLLGVEIKAKDADLVATRAGDLFSFESKVVAVVSPRRGLVDII